MRSVYQNRFQRHLQIAKAKLQAGPLGFHAALSEQLIRKALHTCGIQFRTRVYTPWVTLWAFMGQFLSSDGGCLEAQMQINAWRKAEGKAPVPPNSGHYTDARKRLSVEFLHEVFRLQRDQALADIPQQWKWKGKYEVKFADGMILTLNDTPANRAAYPPDGEKEPGTRYPQIRAVAVLSLTLGIVLDWRFGPYQGKGTGESSLFRKLIPLFNQGDIVLGDKYYCCYRDVCSLVKQGAQVVVKHFKSRTTLSKIRSLGKGDGLYLWHRPKHAQQKMSAEEYAELPESLEVRVLTVRVAQRGFRVQVFEILTTLTDAEEHSAEDIGELYLRRWQGEVRLRDIKTTLGMEMLRCRTPEMIEKELLVGLLAYNSIRIQMAQVADCLEIPLHEISFKAAVKAIQTLDQEIKTQDDVAHLFALIAYRRVGNRPGRSEPRAVKAKGRTYEKLKKGRPSYSIFTAS